MEQSILEQTELNNRAKEVFFLRPGDFIYDVYVEDDGSVRVSMQEIDDETGDYIDFNYLPDMTERPEALDYLMGKRDDFDD